MDWVIQEVTWGECKWRDKDTYLRKQMAELSKVITAQNSGKLGTKRKSTGASEMQIGKIADSRNWRSVAKSETGNMAANLGTIPSKVKVHVVVRF